MELFSHAEAPVFHSKDATIGRVSNVMRQVFGVSSTTAITRSTSSVDIDGWDSLSHSLFILGVENEFGMDLPLDKTYEMKNIGELVDLIAARQAELPGGK